MEIIREQQNISWAPQPNKIQEILDDQLPPRELVTSVFGYIFDGTQVLLTHNPRGWEIPGGHVEPGESLEEAAKREVLEETCAEVEILKPFCYQKIELFGPKPANYSYPFPVSYQVFFLARLISLEEFIPKLECDNRMFIPFDQAPDFRISPTRLQAALKLHQLNNNP